MMTGDQAQSTVASTSTQWSLPRRLLLLGCSKAKTPDDGLIPAIQRYDGPAFRVLRRYLRERPDPALQTFILSAEHGIITADAAIPHYDRRMTPARSRQIRPHVSDTLSRLFNGPNTLPEDPEHILLILGKDYRDALSDYAGSSGWFTHRCVAGRPGEQLAQLKSWLYAESSP